MSFFRDIVDCSVYFYLIFISHFYRNSSWQFNIWKISNNGSRSYLLIFELGFHWYKFDLKAGMSETRISKSNRKTCHLWSPYYRRLLAASCTNHWPCQNSHGRKIHSCNSTWTNRHCYHLFSLWHISQHLFYWRLRNLTAEELLSTKTASSQRLVVLLSFSCSKLIEMFWSDQW